ncbi:hypothetical protein [Crateriforma conspicua]|uniref:hypothetical protein n=1 Tax=Crateriforma conspicua TaxID=2527996 RepID=UPI0011B41E90|nr:hypothetical protein [Crateriforma conspicua]
MIQSMTASVAQTNLRPLLSLRKSVADTLVFHSRRFVAVVPLNFFAVNPTTGNPMVGAIGQTGLASRLG